MSVALVATMLSLHAAPAITWASDHPPQFHPAQPHATPSRAVEGSSRARAPRWLKVAAGVAGVTGLAALARVWRRRTAVGRSAAIATAGATLYGAGAGAQRLGLDTVLAVSPNTVQTIGFSVATYGAVALTYNATRALGRRLSKANRSARRAAGERKQQAAKPTAAPPAASLEVSKPQTNLQRAQARLKRIQNLSHDLKPYLMVGGWSAVVSGAIGGEVLGFLNESAVLGFSTFGVGLGLGVVAGGTMMVLETKQDRAYRAMLEAQKAAE